MGIDTESILRNETYDDQLMWTPSFREYWSTVVAGVPVEYIRLYGRLIQDTLIATAVRQAFEAGWTAREKFRPPRRRKSPWEVRTMPLLKGRKAKSKKGIARNIRTEMKAGRSQAQSVAIAMRLAGRPKKKARRAK